MDAHLKVLRKAGWVLIIVGLVDIGYMIWCITQKVSYQSSFNIFAVIAGIFLIRGSLKAAKIISMLIAFVLTCVLAVILILPLILPPSLLLTYLRLNLMSAVGYVMLIFLAVSILFWIYRSLTCRIVRNAMDERGINYTSFWRRPSLGFWIGGCLVLFLVCFLVPLLHGKTAKQAREKAAMEVGQGYRFVVTNMNISYQGGSKFVRATVVAYNEKEIRDISVQWSE